MRELLEAYVPRVYRFALHLTNDPHAAEDLTQETLLRAWQRRDLLRDPAAARVWLFRIAANLWRDGLRRDRSPVARAGPLCEDHVQAAPSAERKVAGCEDVARALAALNELPQRQREVLYLNACEDLSGGEIAEVLGVSPEAVKASLSLARKRLREQLHDLFTDLYPGHDERIQRPPR